MGLTEGQRLALARDLTASIGEESAAALMSSILPEGTEHLATRADVKGLEAKTEAGFTEIHAKVDAGFTEIHAKVDAGFTEIHAKVDAGFKEVHAKMDAGFTEVHAKMDAGFTELRSDIKEMVSDQLRSMTYAMVGFIVVTWAAIAGILVAFVQVAN